MNRKEVIQLLARDHKMSQERVALIIDGFCNLVTTCVKGEEDVTIRGWGKFESRFHEATTKIHPATGEPVTVPEKLAIGFVPSALLKKKLNS